jgi:membrane associated rhomboid family serine protease
MIARWLAREARDFPATLSLCVSWVVVFAAMTYYHLESGEPLSAFRWLGQGFGGGDTFGDLTLDDLARGQVWRLITCNFVHFSLVHIALNLMSMYVLGALVESWYGPHQLILVYGLTGGGGNLLSSLARLWLRSNREVHSAGASVAIMGLIGICAVAGWRSGTADGRRIARLMVIFTLMTAALGLFFPRNIDNWGHGGGLVVGLALGLAHHRLLARVGKPTAWGAGMLTILVFAASAAAQIAADRREGPARLGQSLVRRTDYLSRASRELHALSRRATERSHVLAASKWLDVLEPFLDGPGRAEIAALRPRLAAELERPPDEAERRDRDERVSRLLESIRRRYEDDQARLRRLRVRR